ncbi:MAG: hypothetical protein EZS28_012470 [Streblomastix strix]|uniref:Uncharacterized protein n=1 Tax=Streblomastix strix TaxID=222440 RepID=A0A5J4WAS4_9EUKA|nr:MAG: hypothetical protein EZS28_012470 [Streblomastix strix]
MHKWMSKVQDLIPVGKDAEGQYLTGFVPGVPYTADWKNKKSRYDLRDRRCESRDRSGSRGYLRSRDYQSSRETRMDIDRNQNEYEFRSKSRDRGRGTFRKRDQNYQGRGWGYQDRNQPYQE